LSPDRLIEIAHTCPAELGGESLDVGLKPDPWMAACAVLVGGTDTEVLDTTSQWFLGTCLAEEFIQQALATGTEVFDT
jgi:hypothetical protein